GRFLTDDELAAMRHFALKVETHMTDDTFAKLPFACPNEDFSSWKSTKSQAHALAGFTPKVYHCCMNSCICYVGPHAEKTQCPYCQESRYRADGKTPRKRFTYLPITPRLRAYYRSLAMIDKLKYRGSYEHFPEGPIRDIMDGSHYQRLCQQHVNINGEQYPHTFFSDSRDVMFGLSTDGFAPWKRRKKT
ncbi:hypothetical protein EV361DRAFT_780461, partial [Lentinula raphanica]